MRCLVTGGAGFIGSNLVAHLVGQGHPVTVLDNFASGYRTNLDPYSGITLVQADVRDTAAVTRAARGCAVVFHLAASVGNKRSIDDPTTDSEINLLGTLNVLEAARHHGIERIVLSSSAGIFGELQTVPIAEDHPAEPDSPYGVSKLAAEKMCLAYAKLYGIRAACLRYFNVYGRNQRYDAYGNVIPIFAHRIYNGMPLVIFGDGQQTRDFVEVRDVVAANYAAATAGASGAFNIASGSRITIAELATEMVRLGGRDTRIEHAAPRPGDVRHSLADVSAARLAFGYDPRVRLPAGLRDYMRWARTELAA